LEAGEEIVCELSAVMQFDEKIEIHSLSGGPRRMKRLVNSNATATANVAVMAGCAGRAGVFDLGQHRGRLLCPQDALMAAGPGVAVTVYSRYRSIGANGFDLLLLEGRGWAFLHACGNVKDLTLGPGKQAQINVAALAAMSATVDFEPMRLKVRDVQANFAVLTGPGRVWLQSGVQ
ncbi:MAG: AIM24 family protein, partial [Aestuariivirgaceae bacterium]